MDFEFLKIRAFTACKLIRILLDCAWNSILKIFAVIMSLPSFRQGEKHMDLIRSILDGKDKVPIQISYTE